MLSEIEKRRHTFDLSASTAVELPGGTWFLPRPFLRLQPVFRSGKRISEARLTCGDPQFDQLKDAVTAATSDESIDFGGAVTDVAVYMLLKNYELTDDDLGEIFAIPMVDGAAVATDCHWMTEVMAIANGRGAPKAGSGGGD